MSALEVQIDRIVGPTHHFGGLGVGNLASQLNAGQASNPQAAALQGLDKMRLVASLGVPQLILPPQPRPDFHLLADLGYRGAPEETLKAVLESDPALLSAAASCSAMWTANAATVTPSCDSEHGMPVMTVANLNASLHRSIEAAATREELRALFRSGVRLHDALPGGAALRDEGAANHMRLAESTGKRGLHVFVHGDGKPAPRHHWPRQTLATGKAISRTHGLREADVFHVKQHPDAIDAGAFHNDVVAMSHHDLLIHHELAFAPESESQMLRLERRFAEISGKCLRVIRIHSEELTLTDAINTYFFNSQIVSSSNSGKPVWTILCPVQVQHHKQAHRLIQRLCADGVFQEAHFVDLGQSMDGGGGPACLRLRVPVTEHELGCICKSAWWTESLDSDLRDIINERYPHRLELTDLADAEFCYKALETQRLLSSRLGHDLAGR